jgi:membrane protease YdiL (CAAX protease family)
MAAIWIFVGSVVLSGWILGYLLAKEMKGKQQPTPMALVFSLLAVAMPTVMAFILSQPEGRATLLRQFSPESSYPALPLALLFPFLIATAGHIGGYFKLTTPTRLFPASSAVKQGLQMIIILIVWGLLEEIGWRGFLLPELLERGWRVLPAALFIGAIWGLWHAPQMFFNQQLKETMKGRVGLGIFLWSLQCLLLGGVLGWLQYRSGSFLLPAIAHALVNLLGNVSDSTLGKEKDALWAGTSGVYACGASLAILIALYH